MTQQATQQGDMAMNINRAKEIATRRFDGVRAGEFTKDELLEAMRIVRNWKYENDPKYRANMEKAAMLGRALSAR